MKTFSKYDIIKRINLLYDRYHNFFGEDKTEFWFMSCKKHEKKNIITLFQNNKQLYCNIDNIYDCSLHSNNDPNFDNPSCYDQIKFLKTYKKLLEFSFVSLYFESQNFNNNEFNMEIESDNDNEKDILNQNKLNDINNINNDNNIKSNNDLGSINESSKIVSLINSKEAEENSEIIVELKDGTNQIIYLNYKKEEENISNSESLKSHIIDLIFEFNQTLKNIKCHSTVVSPIKKIKSTIFDTKKCCSDLCYKNLLICENNLYDKAYLMSKDKNFPTVYELLFVKFLQMIKFDPCRIYKLMKVFINDKINSKNFHFNCSDIYFHLLSKKFKLKNIILKELFDLNMKEHNRKKNKASLTLMQTKKIEENNNKEKNMTFIPCIHFGVEICDESCPCSKRGYCEIYCRCNQILCKFAYHGCHCSKGDCKSNHCPCFKNGRECNDQTCKKCIDRCKNNQLEENYESKLIVGESKIAGWGLFANEDIGKDNLIGEYKGELINDEIVSKRDRFKDYEGSTYMFKLDDEYTVDSRRMGNLLRYANHSKVNSNSYPKIIFSEGHQKIGLYAKRYILKGEEILFDYDGQGILGKQFSWINDEKKVISNEKLNNKKNNSEVDSNDIKIISEEMMPKKEHNYVNDSNINSTYINSHETKIVNNINTKNNPKKKSGSSNRGIIYDYSNKFTEKKVKEKIDDNYNNGFNRNISKSINLNINNPFKHLQDINEKNNLIIPQKEEKKEKKTNIIDLLSDKNFTKNFSNKKNKTFFITEEKGTKTSSNNKYQFEKDKSNIFDIMNEIKNDLVENNGKYLGKKRYEQKKDNSISPSQNKLNFTISNNENDNQKENSLIKNILKKDQNNLKSPIFKELKNIFENKESKQKENESKLKRPVFADNSFEKMEKKGKIYYNFISCENLNFPIKSQNLQENIINNINVINNNTTNESYQTKNRYNNEVYNIGNIRLITTFENPIMSDFAFYSPINTDKLKKVELLKCETINLSDNKIDIDFNKDICGYVVKNINISNMNNRIFKDYLDGLSNYAYFCKIPECNSVLYIISNGSLFEQIEKKYNFNCMKTKKLLFILKSYE